MLKIFLLVSVFLTVIYAGEETKTFSNKDFTNVSICCGMKVRISQADNYSIRVTADSKDFDNLAVKQDGSELSFYIKKNNYRIKNEIKIEISLPALHSLNLSGGAMGNLLDIKSQGNFSANLSGGAILKGTLESKSTELDLSGGSTVAVKGTGGNLSMNGSGGCTFDLKDFAVRDVDSEFSGGTVGKVSMNGTLNTSQSGGSQLTFYGTAKMGRTSFSGGSEVVKGD